MTRGKTIGRKVSLWREQKLTDSCCHSHWPAASYRRCPPRPPWSRSCCMWCWTGSWRYCWEPCRWFHWRDCPRWRWSDCWLQYSAAPPCSDWPIMGKYEQRVFNILSSRPSRSNTSNIYWQCISLYVPPTLQTTWLTVTKIISSAYHGDSVQISRLRRLRSLVCGGETKVVHDVTAGGNNPGEGGGEGPGVGPVAHLVLGWEEVQVVEPGELREEDRLLLPGVLPRDWEDRAGGQEEQTEVGEKHPELEWGHSHLSLGIYTQTIMLVLPLLPRWKVNNINNKHKQPLFHYQRSILDITSIVFII